jgi:hypothetical protein
MDLTAQNVFVLDTVNDLLLKHPGRVIAMTRRSRWRGTAGACT